MNAMLLPLIGNARAEAGWPDRIIIHKFWQGLIEFKGPETVVSPKQKYILAELWKRSPGVAYMLREPGILTRGNGEVFENVVFTNARDLILFLQGDRVNFDAR